MTSSASLDTSTAPYAALLLRLALGTVFLAHALFKVLALSLPETARYFADHGFPAWSAYAVFALELAGGVLLLLGLKTRLVALALVPVAAGALLVHWPNGWHFAASEGGFEYPAFLIAALLVQSGLGDGAAALSRHARVSASAVDGARR